MEEKGAAGTDLGCLGCLGHASVGDFVFWLKQNSLYLKDHSISNKTKSRILVFESDGSVRVILDERIQGRGMNGRKCKLHELSGAQKLAEGYSMFFLFAVEHSFLIK